MPSFVIKIQDIEEHKLREYSFPITKEWLRGQLAATDVGADDLDLEEPVDPKDTLSGKISVVARMVGVDIMIESHIETTIYCGCVRCLQSMALAVDSNDTFLMSPAGDAKQAAKKQPNDQLPVEDLDLTPEELMAETYSGDEIVLDTIIREQILLEIPMDPICVDRPCDPEVIAHINAKSEFDKDTPEVDPRLLPLLSLSKKIEES